MRRFREGVDLLNGKQPGGLNSISIAAPHALASPTMLDLIDSVTLMESPVPSFKIEVLRVEAAAEAMLDGQCDFLLAFDIHSLFQPPFETILYWSGKLPFGQCFGW